MKNEYFQKAVIRVPLYPTDFYFQLVQTGDAGLRNLLHDTTFLHALYLASPQLYRTVKAMEPEQVLENSKKAKKIRLALLKYAYRLSTRCTPFGLFAGNAVITVKDETNLLLEEITSFKQHTRLDITYLASLSAAFSTLSCIQPYLCFKVNSSLYKLGEAYRYIECQYINGKRKLDLVSIDATEYVTKVIDTAIAAGALSVSQLASSIVEEGTTQQEAEAFVEQLIEAQVLLSELELGTTGEELEVQLYQAVQKIVATQDIAPAHRSEIRHLLHYLEEVRRQAEAVDRLAIKDKFPAYERLKALAAAFGHPFEEQSLLQTDLTTVYKKATVDKALVQQVQEGVECLSRFIKPTKNARLEQFKNAFENRYESQVIPLVEALDIESGIGYGEHMEDSFGDIAPLIDDISFIPSDIRHKEHHLTLERRFASFWIKKVTEALVDKANSITLNEKDVAQFPVNPECLTSTYSVMTSLFEDKEQKSFVQIQGITGPTAATWLGRFCNQDSAMNSLVQEIADTEEQVHKGKIVAEINHLPEARLGNVLQRPVIRKYEIPYLANSAVAKENQLGINDLMLCVRNNRLVLLSEKHQQEVVPYLTNSHFYSNGRSLPLYHFLCDMQELHGQEGGILDLSAYRRLFTHIPRITYKSIILKRASWHFGKADMQEILNAPEEELPFLFKEFASRHRLPQLISFARRDHEMIIDISSLPSLQVLLEEIKHLEFIVLTEVLFNDLGSPVVNQKGERFNNEVLFFFKREPKNETERVPEKIERGDMSLQRNFIPGDKWVYFTLYTGFKNADKLLLSMHPIIRQLLAEGVIDKWFFIRYRDPKFHIRIRFHLTDADQYNTLYRQLHPLLEAYKDQKLLWRVSVDTYERELERYGPEGIGPVEEIFYHDSTLYLDMMQLLDQQEEELRWQFSLLAMDAYLASFGLSLEEKKNFTQKVTDLFAKEFSASTSMSRSIDLKYRSLRSKVSDVFQAEWRAELGQEISSILHNFKANLAKQVQELESLDGKCARQVVDSLIHMHVNRLFRSRQRIYEFVLYSFLKKHYTSQLAQQVREREVVLA